MITLSSHILPVEILSPGSSPSTPSQPAVRITLFDVSSTRITETLNLAEKSTGAIEAISVDCCSLDMSQFGRIFGLVNPRVVQRLLLRGCNVSVNEGKSIAKCLISPECTLVELDLRWNDFGDECTEIIADGLLKNKTLEKLFLSKNNITGKALPKLVAALIENRRLELLDLEENELPFCGEFGPLLQQNNTLRTLQLSGNPIQGKNLENSLCIIGEALGRNLSIQKITLPKITGADASLNYWLGIIDQQIKRNVLLRMRGKMKQTLLEAENDSKFEPGPNLSNDMESIKANLQNMTISLQSQLSQLSHQLQTDMVDLHKKCTTAQLNNRDREKKKNDE
jgi:hypothetical protein